MAEPLIILCPLRSFSSVTCGILGQHPDLYGLPELNLFVADTVGDFLMLHRQKERPQGLHGLKRTLAQLHAGVQTEETVMDARRWLNERQDWTTGQLYEYILEAVAPRIGVDKSPITVMRRDHMERAYAMFPQANFLHLTRHPVSAKRSIQDFFTKRSEVVRTKQPAEGKGQGHPPSMADSFEKLVQTHIDQVMDPFKLWLDTHRRIIDFTDQLPAGQSMRIQGEVLLSDPDLYLPQIAEWLGVRTDEEAVEAMKHPENSPYASLGPLGARFGNDVKFLKSPKLRQGKVIPPTLEDDQSLFLGQDYSSEIVDLGHLMGYV